MKKIGETLDRALTSDNKDPESSDSEEEHVEEPGATALTPTQDPKPSGSRWIPANKRKKS